ncbi:substrate-binding domain-containing protein [Williamsia sterculiae]|uniref:von Willebrand factor type A domain-containing protein n=1 Tax=Williamsia sterculiae TaxID=1344003 RepID=A0A1N7DHA8_9NOCA|nr:substrate-binding domain-containing protein [Williamsia sterculiae]SIR75170.1 von Willebrand factor type A domain-containing protein [Williamsia sterculiae]
MGRHHAGAETPNTPGNDADDFGFSDRGVKRRASSLWATMTVMLVVVVVAVGLIAWKVFGSDGSDCGSRRPIEVAAEPAMAAALKQVATDASTVGCHDFTVTAAPASVIPGLLSRGDGGPDLWIADTRARAEQSTRQVRIPTDIVNVSVASTPALVAGARVGGLDNWVDVMKTPNLRMGSPLATSTGDAPVIGALAAVQDGRMKQSELTDAMTVLAIQQGNIRTSDDSESARLGVADSTGDPVVTDEQSFLQYQRSHPRTVLKAVVPRQGTVFLEHPLVNVSPAARHRDTATAARELLGRIESGEGQKALREAGFRPSDRSPIDGRGVGAVPQITVRDPSQVDKTLRQWSVLGVPIRTLVTADVSGSMNDTVAGGESRADLLSRAMLQGNSLFPDNTEAGVWFFSTDRGPGGRPWEQKAAIERENATVSGGRKQRDVLNDLARGYPGAIGGGTGLYDTVLAAFTKVQDGYDPNYSNSVIVLTDGRNDDAPNSIGLSTLLSRLAERNDPARPVMIITIGISADADADALRQIADATPGGSSYVARTPEDISSVFVKAIQGRVTAAGR